MRNWEIESVLSIVVMRSSSSPRVFCLVVIVARAVANPAWLLAAVSVLRDSTALAQFPRDS
jgi:hypothetical protein